LALISAGAPVLLGPFFVTDAEVQWAAMNGPLLIGSTAATVAVLIWSAGRVSAASLARAAVAMGGLAWAAEFSGMRWDIPFGAGYGYHPALHPTVAGVPVAMIMGWFVIAQSAVNLVSGWPGRRSLIHAAAFGSVFVAAHSLLLDPLAISMDAWGWRVDGSWYGTPWSNHAGWLVVGFGLCLTGFALQQPLAAAWARRSRLEAIFLVSTAALLVTATVAAERRLESLVPGALTMAITAPYWWLWWVGRFRERPAHPSGG
jgi:uncharacterized membrane protein